MRRWPALLLLLMLCASFAGAQERPRTPEHPRRDSLPAVLPAQLAGQDTVTGTARNERFYDSLQVRSGRSKVSRLLIGSLLVRKAAAQIADGKAVDESALYREFEGRRINRIDIVRHDLIGRDSLWIERAANSIHVTTREWVIRRDVLYHTGEKLDPDLVVKTNSRINDRSHISNAITLVQPDPDDPEGVIVTITTRDNWSIGADASTGASGRTMLKLYDDNFLGTGSHVGLSSYFTWKGWDFGGTMFDMDVPNLFGTFANLHLDAGRNFENSVLGASLQKEFQLKTDYAGGASWYDRNQETYMLYADSSMQVKSRALDVWLGGALYLKGIRSSLYLTARYSGTEFSDRPIVAPRLNPAFHEDGFWIAGVGLYRERFYAASLIYGYGYREYLPTGYRLEVNAGWLDGQFGDHYYVGASYRLGGFNRIGFLMGGIGIGNYISREDGRWGRGALNLESRYFTNLIKTGKRTHVRQFVTLDYLQGWNRYLGSDEVVAFNGTETLRGLEEYATGVNRAKLGLETVIFTPYQPLGFRLTMFVYSDMGLLGTYSNPFRNTYFSTVGFGIRIKNERLVFKAFELRFGLAMNREGLLQSQYFSASTQPRVAPVRFTPEAPHAVLFR